MAYVNESCIVDLAETLSIPIRVKSSTKDTHFITKPKKYMNTLLI